jgi:transaldolase
MPFCSKNRRSTQGCGGDAMKGTELLRYLGEGLWLENMTRDLLDASALKHYLDEPTVTEVPSHTTILHRAVRPGKIAIRNGRRPGAGRVEESDPFVPKVKETSHGPRI